MNDDINIEEPQLKDNIPSQLKLERIRKASRDILSKRREQVKSQPSQILDNTSVYQETTVSEKTLIAYNKNANRLYRKWLKEMNYDLETKFEDMDASDFVNWLISCKPEWKAKTWRLYRQSVYMMLLDYKLNDEGNYVDYAIQIIQEDAVVRAKDSKSGLKKGSDVADGKKKENSSSLKYKKFPLNDLKRIVAWLRFKSRSSNTRDLEHWIRATLITGLRPTEWKGTDLVIVPDKSSIHGRRAYLHIICAKATNGRGFDVVRTLDLSTIPDNELNIIKEQSEKSLKWYENDTFNLHYRDCADLLKRACVYLWPKRKMRYTLYSCRHQAIANWKASGMSKIEIAVLAGHASFETAGEAYGRKTSGWVDLKNVARPTKEQLDIAKQRQKDVLDRITEKRAGSPGKMPFFNID